MRYRSAALASMVIALASPLTSLAQVNPGTTGSLAKYVTANSVGSSAVYEVGGRLGVNTAMPRDILHTLFTNTGGGVTGIAVQNLGNTATSYSGMLFYDQNGVLGQFQGFNNVTHEYRINNVASAGTINFMLAGASAARVNNNRSLDVNSLARISHTTAGSRGEANGWVPNPFGPIPGVFLEGGVNEGGGFYADEDFAAIWSPGDNDILQVFDEDFLPDSASALRFAVTNEGDIRVGLGTTGCVRDADGTTIAGTCVSDERLKKDIRPFDGAMLDRLLKLRPVYYHYRPELTRKSVGPNAGEAYGFIAQEVEKIYPEMVTTTANGYKAVDYGRLQYVLLGALQEEHAKSEALNAKVATLEGRLAKLEAASTRAANDGSWPNAWAMFAGLGALGLTLRRRLF
jgi:hypothetical protein